MRKIYLFVFLFVTSLCASAQVALPIYYDFMDELEVQGFAFENNDASCWMNNALSGRQYHSVYGDCFWFISGFSDCGTQYRQYLISPRFVNSTSDSVQIRFRYFIPDNSNLVESFVVGYCLSDQYSSMDDFLWSEDVVSCTNNSVWQNFQCNLPPQAQYVAIAYTSGNQYALVIDDLLLRSDSPNVFYPFTVNANAGGIVSVSTGGQMVTGSTSVLEGDDLTYTVTADPGFYIGNLWLDGTPNFGATGQSVFSQTLLSVIGAHTLDVVFNHYEYSIQIAATEHGRVVPDGGDFHQLIVPWDTTVGFRFIPDNGYHVSRVAVSSGGLTTYYYGDTLTLYNVRANYSLQVTFEVSDFVVTATAGEGGTITPSGEVNVQGFSTPQFRITANPGFVIDTVYVDSEPLLIPHYTDYIYTFDSIVGNHTIEAIFFHQPYIVHYAHTPHGSISATGGVVVGLDSLQIFYEDTVIFNFLADEGYELSDLQLNGASVGVENPYLLTHVSQNSLLEAVFEEKTFQVTAQAHGSGSVAPHSTSATGYFDTVQFVLTANVCAQADSILLDGVRLDLADTVSITHLEGNHMLDVYFSPVYYTMELLQTSNGLVEGASEVICGGTARLKLVPDHCYQVVHFLLDGEIRDDLRRIVNDTVWAYIPSVMADHTASAEFERRTYNVSVNATGAGTVTSNVVGTVVCDTTLLFEIVPDECHYVSSVTVNGVDAEPMVQHFPCSESGFGDTLRLELAQIEQNQTVAVNFSQFDFPLTLNAGEHGTLTIPAAQQLLCGTDATVAIVPDACYQITSVVVDGTDVTGDITYNGTSATYTFQNVHSAHSLSASFEQQSYTVSVQPALHGTIVPDEDTVVLCGNGVEFLIVPDACYQIDTVWLNGIAVNSQLDFHPNVNYWVGDSASFALDYISENQTVQVSYKPIEFLLSASVYGNGSVSLSVPGETVACGTPVTVTMTPDDCHSITGLFVNGTEITDYQVDNDGVGTYVIAGAESDIFLSVVYERNHYVLSLAQPTQHGSIVYPSGDRNCGDTVQVLFVPDECYHLDSVMIGNVWIPKTDLSVEESGYSYSIQDIRVDMLLDAVFSMDSVHFVSREGAPLSVTDSMLPCGASLTVCSVREDCEQLDSVCINGVVVTAMDDTEVNLWESSDTLFVRFNAISEDCELAVFYSHIHYGLTTSVVGHGHVTASVGSSVACGDSIAMVISAENCHHLDSVSLSGVFYPIDNDTLLIVNDMRSDMDFTFYFSDNLYEVTAQSNEYGYIYGDSGQVVCGRNLNYTFKPADCAMLDSVYLDGVCVNELLEYQQFPMLHLYNVSENHHISAIFKRIPYTIEVDADNFSFVDVPSVNVVECGSSFVINIATDTCHYISEIQMDGVSILPESEEKIHTYRVELPLVDQNHSFSLSFSQIVYSVSSVFMDQGGQILSSSVSPMECGRDTTLYLAVTDDCYVIDSVLVNGERVEPRDSIMFENVVGNIEMVVRLHRLTYTVEVLDHPHCSISVGDSVQTRSCGSDIHLEFIADEGYYISALVIDGESVPVANSCDFSNLHANHTVSIQTELYRYTILSGTNGFGSVTPDSVVVRYGESCTLQIQPDACYRVENVLLDGQPIDAVEVVTFESVVANHRVEVEFARIAYRVEVVALGNGQVSAPAMDSIYCGDNFVCNIIPEDCYKIEAVYINEIESSHLLEVYDDYSKLVLSELSSDINIRVVFEEIHYSCDVVASGGGSVTLSDSVVACGTFASVLIVPEACHYLGSVTVNGENVPLGMLTAVDNGFVLEMNDIRDDQHVEVYFEQFVYTVTVDNRGNGSVVVSHDSVACGEDFSFFIAPARCTRLVSVRLNDEDITPRLLYRENSNPWLSDTAYYTVNEVHCNQAIVVEYGNEDPHHIDVAFIAGTDVIESNDIVLDCDGDTVVELMMDCYTLDSVLVDGVRIPDVDSYAFANVVADHTVQAFFTRNQYQIVAESAANGSLYPAGTSIVTCGGNKTYTITPNQGYYIENLIVDGDTLAPSATFSFTNVREDHTIEPVFAVFTYPITVTVAAGGNVTPGDSVVTYGSSVHYDIVPENCYSVDSVVVNGQNQGALASYVFENVTAPQTLYAYFSLNRYSVVSETVGEGTVVLSDMDVDCGGAVAVAATPANCYSLDSVVVNGENMGAVTSYVIDDIYENQFVTAYFSQILYNVEMDESVEHGTIVFSSATVPCGDEVTLTVQPDACYFVDSVLINGVNVGAVMTYTIQNIVENQNVAAYFSVNEYEVEVMSGAHGSVTSIGTTRVECGDNFSITITPDDCYAIGPVYVNGTWMNPYIQDNVLTVNDIAEDCQISVNFELIRYYQRAVCNLGGTVSPSFTAAPCGSDVTYVIEPIDCYRVDTVWINGIVLPSDSLVFNGDVASFTLHDIRQANNIVVRFAGILYQFEVENNGDGIVNLTQHSVNCDGEVSFTVLPSQCERIQTIFLNGHDITQDIQYHVNINPMMPDTASYTITRMDTDQFLQINYMNLPDNTVSIVFTDGENTLFTVDSALACAQSMVLPIVMDCYTVDSVLLNDENVGAVSSLLVSSNLDDQMVVAYFTRNRYEVSMEAGAGGSVTFASGTSVLCGDNLSCEVVPDECYQIDSVVINGVNMGAVLSFVFENVTDDQSGYAYFSRRTYSVDASAAAGGSISPAGMTTLLCGGTLAYQIIADECYSIDSVVVNGVNEGSIDSYVFENIVEDQNIVAYFSRNEYSFVATASAGGQIAPSGTVSVPCGEQQTYSITPNDCQQIDSLVVNGVNVGALSTYVLYSSEETGNQQIIAYFSQRNYPIVCEAGEGGSVSPVTDTLVACGGSLAVTVVPEDCYSIASLVVDGNDRGNQDAYTFENVQEGHTLVASFVRNEYSLTPVAHSGGTVTPNVTTTVDCGADFTFYFAPNSGHYISAVVVDGDTLEAADSYTFTDVRENHRVQPVFSLSRYEIVSSSGVGGSVSPTYSIVDYMGRQTITISADD